LNSLFVDIDATVNTAFSQMAEKRTYELKERARKQADTRRRIVEATVALHEEVGPARTTVAEIARRAGVQRLTVYNHFPDERELFGACSAHFAERTPPPDPSPWAAMSNPGARLRAALMDLHAWYRVGAPMLEKVERDAPQLPALLEVVQTSREPFDRAVRELLADGWRVHGARRRRVQAAIGLATSFSAWEQLTAREGLDDTEAVELLAGAVEAAAGAGPG
jgi:AcrR family transcriptional regulator